MKYNVWNCGKNKIKRLLKKVCHHVEMKDAKWLAKRAEAFRGQARRKIEQEIFTQIHERTAYPCISRMMEYAIDELMCDKNYTWNYLLVIKNPYQYAPLSAMILFHTRKSYKVRVTVQGKTKDVDVVYETEATKRHRVAIVGLYPDRMNTVVLQLLDERGRIRKEKIIRLQIEPLKQMPQITIAKKNTTKKYLFDFTLVYGGGNDMYPYAFDRNGDVRFQFTFVPKTYGFQPISDGKFLLLNKSISRITATNPASVQMFEVDQMGRFLKIYNTEKGMHHEFLELENGNFVAASNAFAGGTFEDTVIEMERNTGKIVNEIYIKDYVDNKYVDSSDWAHLNSIEYCLEEKTVIVSLRNLHTVLKVNYEKKELLWVLANPKFYQGSTMEQKLLRPQGEMQWFFQQHAAYFIDENHLMIYDNHIDKRNPVPFFDQEKQSFVRIYEIDEENKTVKLIKSFPCEKSSIRSNAIFDKKSNRIFAMSGKLKAYTKEKQSMIKEFDYENGEVFNQYELNHGYYRAYQFTFEGAKMCERMDTDTKYVLGKVYPIRKCEAIDVRQAKELSGEEVTEKEEFEQEIESIKMRLEEDVLCVTIRDHLLEKLYLVGQHTTYERSFLGTVQERPEYFAKTNSTDPIPLRGLEEDCYEVYFKHEKGLYRSGTKIQIKDKGVLGSEENYNYC